MEKHQGKRPSQNHGLIIEGSNNLVNKSKGMVLYKLLIASNMPRPRAKGQGIQFSAVACLAILRGITS